MADYDSYNPRSTGSALETVVSTSQALPSSCESMWEGWTQTSTPATQIALAEQVQQLGSYTTNTKNVSNSYQHDLLSSWLMSGIFQNAGLQQQQAEDGSDIALDQDELCRLNIRSSTSDHHSLSGLQSDASQQFYLQTCSSNVQTNKSGGQADVEQSAQFLTSPPRTGRMDSLDAHGITAKLDIHADLQVIEQMNVTDLTSRASSTSLPAGLNSYGQMMQHLVGQFDSSNFWSRSSTALASVSPQPSDCSGGMRSPSQQEDHPHTSCDSVILHQQHSKKRCEGDAVYSNDSNPGTDLTDRMYAELHGHSLLTKNHEAPAHGAADHEQHLAICTSNPAESYRDQSSWTQFSVDPTASAGPSHAGIINIQDVDQTMLDTSTLDTLSTAAKRDELSPSSAGTSSMSRILNLNAVAAAGHGQAVARGSADLNNTEKSEQTVARQKGVNAEESVKRSCIEYHRNLWQVQSQALFGRVPDNFLLGSSSNNSGSLDMHTAMGPALNTNGRPRARRGSATDPQSVYARHRRERINDRLRVLQHLVPNGAKVDIVTMLEEAISYVKFLQLQVRLLSSDDLWMYAPTTYNGVDVSMGIHAGLLNPQA